MPIRYITTKDLATVKTELTQILAQEIKKDFIKISWEGNELVVRIEKMGTSEIRLGLRQEGSQEVSISETKRNIAMMHKPFASDVEKMVERILGDKLGAQKG